MCIPTGLIGCVAFFCRLSQAFLLSLSPPLLSTLYKRTLVLVPYTRDSLPAFPVSSTSQLTPATRMARLNANKSLLFPLVSPRHFTPFLFVVYSGYRATHLPTPYRRGNKLYRWSSINSVVTLNKIRGTQADRIDKCFNSVFSPSATALMRFNEDAPEKSRGASTTASDRIHSGTREKWWNAWRAIAVSTPTETQK